MTVAYATYALLTIILITHVQTEQEDSFGRLYEKGVEAYLEERYPLCVEYLEHAVDKYRSQKKLIQNCRLKCKHESEQSVPLYPVDVEDLRFYEKTVRTTLCILKCQQRNMGGTLYHIDEDIRNIFEKRKPYEYLHLCYYKINDKQRAASSAFTYLVSNPDHELMKKNLQHYSEMDEVNLRDIVNYEAEDYVYSYVYGAHAYEKKDWQSTIVHMEESLDAYLRAEDECRAQCEGPFNPGWYPDFIPSISNHFTYALKCKRNCTKLLSNVNGQIYNDLLPSHYNYLQYAYFKKGNLDAACQAVASYLLFFPDDANMLSNMKYYKSLPKTSENHFTPRQEAARYAQRDTYERRLIDFIKTEFRSKTLYIDGEGGTTNEDYPSSKESH